MSVVPTATKGGKRTTDEDLPNVDAASLFFPPAQFFRCLFFRLRCKSLLSVAENTDVCIESFRPSSPCCATASGDSLSESSDIVGLIVADMLNSASVVSVLLETCQHILLLHCRRMRSTMKRNEKLTGTSSSSTSEHYPIPGNAPSRSSCPPRLIPGIVSALCLARGRHPIPSRATTPSKVSVSLCIRTNQGGKCDRPPPQRYPTTARASPRGHPRPSPISSSASVATSLLQSPLRSPAVELSVHLALAFPSQNTSFPFLSPYFSHHPSESSSVGRCRSLVPRF